MKKIMMVLAVGAMTACGSPAESEETTTDANTETTTEEISTETQEEVKKAADANVELEQIDGELDSLMNTL